MKFEIETTTFNNIKPLTEEERKRVEENHNLIYAYIKYKHLILDEWYDILAFSLIKAIQRYDENRNATLGTFVYKCFDNTVNAIFKYNNCLARKPEKLLSLDYEYNDSNDDSITLGDYIEDPIDKFEILIDDLEKETFINRSYITERQRLVYNMLMQGLTLDEIAEKLGVTHQAIWEIKNKIQSKYQMHKKGMIE